MQPIVFSAAISGLCAVAAAPIAGWFSHAAGRRAGRGEFISAVQAAASEVIARLREEIDRLTDHATARRLLEGRRIDRQVYAVPNFIAKALGEGVTTTMEGELNDLLFPDERLKFHR